MPSVVILGGSFAGLTIAHKLLKNTLPKVRDLHVTLVTPSTHLYWNVAAIRHVLPTRYAFKDEEVFQPIAPGFEEYSKSKYDLVYGVATSIDDKANTVTVKLSDGKEKSVAYDHLVITTGSSYRDESAWKASEKSYEQTLASVKALRGKIDAANSIVIGGAGTTGVEVAAELGSTFGKKKEITLISSDSFQLLAPMRSDIAQTAEEALTGWGVKVVKGTTVDKSSPTSNGATEVVLSDGKTMTVDLYLPTVGVRSNSRFLPATYLKTRNGDIRVDEYLAAKGAANGNKNVYAAGDCTDVETKQLMHAEQQAVHLASNLDLILRGKEPKPYKPDPRVVQFVSLGKARGVAQFGNWKFPQFLVVMFKSKTLATDRTKATAMGEKLPMGGKMN